MYACMVDSGHLMLEGMEKQQKKNKSKPAAYLTGGPATHTPLTCQSTKIITITLLTIYVHGCFTTLCLQFNLYI